jgi:sugar diacid utilization regulator
VPDGKGPGSWAELRAALAQQPGVHRVAAGAPVEIGELAKSREQADEILDMLRAGLLPGQVGSFDDVWTALVLHRTAAAAAAVQVTELGPLGRLRAHDGDNRTEYLDTLYQWLRFPGDPRAAANALRIHPNTFRYRMRRLAELVPVNLDDPEVRLALLVQLVSLHWT